jgi:tripartite-type tricarboxylate transporter receptor subunit TctC
METVARAAPDGHTLLLASGSLWISQFLRANVPWDPLRDFSPITLAVTLPNIIVVHPSLPVKSVKELIALARSRPGAFNYSSGQIGSSSHLAGELFRSLAGVTIQHVAYKGGGPAILALLGGEVQVSFPNAGSASPHIQSGRMRALAVASARPSPLLPGLPSAADAGLPGYETAAILAVFAPAKTPAAIVDRLNREIVRILNRADVRQRLFDSGAEVVASSPAELLAAMKADMAITGKLVREAGIRAE